MLGRFRTGIGPRANAIAISIVITIAAIASMALLWVNIVPRFTRFFHYYVQQTYAPYRWRLTIALETPQGPRSFSGVFENEDTVMGPGFAFAPNNRFVCVRGDAIPIKINNDTTIYALPWQEGNDDWAKYAPQVVLPSQGDNLYLGQTMPRLHGSRELVREIENNSDTKIGWPSFIRIGAPIGHRFLPVVDPDHLAPGVKVSHIYIEMTHDAISRPLKGNVDSLKKAIPYSDKDYHSGYLSLPSDPC